MRNSVLKVLCTARGPRSKPRPNLHVEFPSVLTWVQAKPVDIIKEAVMMNANIDCNPIIIADRQNFKSQGRTISCVLPEDKLGQLQTWVRKNNGKKLALFTESLLFWTSKKINPTAIMPEVAKNNEEEIIEDTDVSEEAQGTFATNEMEVVDSSLATVPILISKELSRNNTEEIAEVTDALEGAQSDFATTEMEFSDYSIVRNKRRPYVY